MPHEFYYCTYMCACEEFLWPWPHAFIKCAHIGIQNTLPLIYINSLFMYLYQDTWILYVRRVDRVHSQVANIKMASVLYIVSATPFWYFPPDSLTHNYIQIVMHIQFNTLCQPFVHKRAIPCTGMHCVVCNTLYYVEHEHIRFSLYTIISMLWNYLMVLNEYCKVIFRLWCLNLFHLLTLAFSHTKK